MRLEDLKPNFLEMSEETQRAFVHAMRADRRVKKKTRKQHVEKARAKESALNTPLTEEELAALLKEFE